MTEPVVCTLTDILESKNLEKIATNDTNLKLALLEFIEGLHYLSEVHFPFNKKNTVHLNICPDNIFFTEDGRLKLGGFSFVTQTKIEVREL